MSTTRNRVVALVAVMIIFAATTELSAALTETLTFWGTVQPAMDGTSLSSGAWRVYAAGDSMKQGYGMVSDGFLDFWMGDIGAVVPELDVGDDCIATLLKETGTGTISHTGYYAVVNHVLTGDDPAEFPEMTLRQIPIPAVTSGVQAHLMWNAAIEDVGEAGKTNIIGYTVNRSADGVNFTLISTSLVTDTAFVDPIPDDGEYYYAIGLVFRGVPPVTGAVLSANSVCAFKDTDSDTLPDYYEIANGLDETSGAGTNGPAGDADGDTMSNIEEWIAGTKADDSASNFSFKSSEPDNEAFTIQWSSVADRWYSLYHRTDLFSNGWSLIYGPTYCSTNQTMQYFDSLGEEGQHYYRLKVFKE